MTRCQLSAVHDLKVDSPDRIVVILQVIYEYGPGAVGNQSITVQLLTALGVEDISDSPLTLAVTPAAAPIDPSFCTVAGPGLMGATAGSWGDARPVPCPSLAPVACLTQCRCRRQANACESSWTSIAMPS